MIVNLYNDYEEDGIISGSLLALYTQAAIFYPMLLHFASSKLATYFVFNSSAIAVILSYSRTVYYVRTYSQSRNLSTTRCGNLTNTFTYCHVYYLQSYSIAGVTVS